MKIISTIFGFVMLSLLPYQANAFLPGDVNGDGVVSISEVQTVINAFLGLTPPQASTYLPVTVGSTWSYNRPNAGITTQTQKITANSNNQVTMEVNDTTNGKSVNILNFSNSAYYLSSITKYDATGNIISTRTYSPAPGQLFFPSSTTVGYHETQTVQINTQPANTNSSLTFDMTVNGTENIIVPAGTFNNALKIEATNNSGSRYTSWYASNVGLIRQDFNNTKTFELTSYSIK